METAARYTESKIKTYGFETKRNLCLCEFSLGPDQFMQMNRKGANLNMDTIPFEMVLIEPSDDDQYRHSIVVSNHHRNTIGQIISDMNPQHIDIDIRFTAPVELLYFFGPHFGDRFGIADFTYKALAESKIPLIASAFSSSSIFLVLPEHCAAKAKTVFSNRFEIPKTVQCPSFISINSRHSSAT
jgi:aspartokinase